MSSAFKLQSDIASRVAGALDVALAKTEKTSLETSLTENSEAYDCYLQAIEYSDRGISKSDYEIATQLLDRAIRIDPLFAAAFAKLSFVHSNMYWFFYDHTESRDEKSRLAAEKALELSPQLSEAHEAMGWYYYHGKLDYKNALDEFALALKYRPSNSNVYYGIAAVRRRQGDMRGSVESFKKSIAGNPRASDVIRQLAESLMLEREYEEAETYYDKSIELSPDISLYYWEKMKNLLLWKGDINGARQVLEEGRRHSKDEGSDQILAYMSFVVESLDGNFQSAASALVRRSSADDINSQFQYYPSTLLRAELEAAHGDGATARKYFDSARVFLEREQKRVGEDERIYSSLGIVYAGLGRTQEAVRDGLRGVELLPIEKEAWRGSFRLVDLAKIYAMTGEQEKAIDTLERLLSIPSEVSAALLKIDPTWTTLRSNPRFQKLVNHNL